MLGDGDLAHTIIIHIDEANIFDYQKKRIKKIWKPNVNMFTYQISSSNWLDECLTTWSLVLVINIYIYICTDTYTYVCYTEILTCMSVYADYPQIPLFNNIYLCVYW